MRERVYLDWNATAPLRPEARAAMVAAMDVSGNPSSVHGEGRAAKRLVEAARAQVAAAFGASGADLIFVSGATEAAALAMAGRGMASAAVEHEAVAAWGDGALPVDGAGRIAVADPGRSAVQMANSETGVMQELPEGLAVSDMTQAFGKVPVAFDWASVGMALISAHKLGGPKGIGALVIRRGLDVASRIRGGGQEMGRRSGTENVVGIAGFGAAATAAVRDLDAGAWDRVAQLRTFLETSLEGGGSPTILVGKESKRLPNTSCLITPGWKGETQVMALDLAGYAVSAGSACSSRQGPRERGAAIDGLRSGRGRLRDPREPRTGHDARTGGAVRRELPPPQGQETDMNVLDDVRVKDGVDAETVEAVKGLSGVYKHGWNTDIEMEYAPKGLSEDIVRLISGKNDEPEWMLDWRLDAYRRWLKLSYPKWAMVEYPEIDFQDQYYYARPASMTEKPKSLDDVDPKLLETYKKLGIPLKEQALLAGVEPDPEDRKVAVDAVFDSVSLGTTFKKELAKAGVIFCSISEAIQDHPELVKKYLGSVIPASDNYYATLNAAVFSDGSFVYIPKGVRCPMELSTYFRINAENTGQFERTLIIADEGSYVSYLEGCTAPQRDVAQLHAACVELVLLDDAEIKYSTVQNWYPGDENGKGGIYNFVTKRADCRGHRSKVMWTQVETGSAVTWKYPSCILRGDDSQGEFYSIAIANNMQQADTGTKMVHLGKNTKSRIVSKGISAGRAQNTYRGLVSMHPKAKNSRNYTQCDSLLIGSKCGAHTVPYIEVKNNSSRVEHEATTSKVDDDQLFYCRSRGMDEEEAVALVVNGFCKEVLQALPMEFAMEAQALVAISLEGSVG